jgi:biopolymer transport protein ExbB/TolQ
MSTETSEKKATAKAKEALAKDLGLTVTEIMGRRIMWVPFALNPEDSETLALVAKAREQKVFVAPAEALAEWLDENRDELEAEAEKVRVADERTEEEIAKEAERLKKQLETLNAKLSEKKKAR